MQVKSYFRGSLLVAGLFGATLHASAQAAVSSTLSITGTPSKSVVLNSTYSFTPTVSGTNGYTLYYAIQNKPQWANFNPNNGSLSGTPTGATGTYSNISISVSNGHGGSSSLPGFTVTVSNAAPTISGTPASSATAGEFYVFMPTAVESTKYVSMSFSVANLPSWASFSTATGILSGVIPAGTNTTYSNITITVTNSSGQSASLKTFSIKVSPSTSTQAAAQAFVLTSTYDTTQNFNTYFSSSSIDGVSLQEAWNTYEATQGTYSWSHLDTVLALAHAAGKKVSIHMTATNAGLPNWLASAGAKFFTSGGTSYIVPWDSVLLSNYATFIEAMGSHIASEGYSNSIFDVSAVVPELEMNIQGCANNLMGTTTYNRSSYMAAWETVGAALKSGFPSQNKFVSPPGGEAICGTTVDATFYSDLLSNLLGTSSTFWMFAADLNAATSTSNAGSGRTQPYIGTFLGVAGVGYQLIGAATSGGTASLGGTYPGNLQQAICAGLQSGGQYFEIYSLDVLNTNSTIQTGISTVHKPSLCH